MYTIGYLGRFRKVLLFVIVAHTIQVCVFFPGKYHQAGTIFARKARSLNVECFKDEQLSYLQILTFRKMFDRDKQAKVKLPIQNYSTIIAKWC